MFKFGVAAALFILLSGCASVGVIENAPIDEAGHGKSYSIASYVALNRKQQNDLSIALAFSGGGSRAAAFSYGVLEALRQKRFKTGGESRRMIEAVDIISSVSGGSFTAAYYGLFGEKLFTDFKKDFLYQETEANLINDLHDPRVWFGNKTRTEYAIDYFDETLFHGATFQDMLGEDSPLIIINATDLGDGVRFSFIQEYFNLLCSDLSSFPVSRAVTASSAVPVLFSPVVVRNYPGCLDEKPLWLSEMQKKFNNNPELSLVTDGLEGYLKKDNRKYIHLVDGGVTDNLGLRSIYEIMELSGGAREFMQAINRQAPQHLVIIVVDASTYPDSVMDGSKEEPTLEETVNALTDAQIHRYNAATVRLIMQGQAKWAKDLSTEKRPVNAYFIHLRFRDLPDQELFEEINSVPTSLTLSKDQIDKLINAAHELLNNNPEFQRLLGRTVRDSTLN